MPLIAILAIVVAIGVIGDLLIYIFPYLILIGALGGIGAYLYLKKPTPPPPRIEPEPPQITLPPPPPPPLPPVHDAHAMARYIVEKLK